MKEPKARRAASGHQGHRETQAPKVRRAIKVASDKLARKALLALMVRVDCGVKKVTSELLVPMV